MTTPHSVVSERGLRLLCFDGGGVRGLASLFILQQVMSAVGNEPPCSYFDMIGGTSTGALIAIMLGCLDMDIQTCIEKYIEIMDYVFDSPRLMPVNVISGELIPKYKQSKLRERILNVIGNSRVTQGMPPETVRMRRTDTSSHCKVHVYHAHPQAHVAHSTSSFVVATDANTNDDVQFTNYTRPFEQQSSYFDQVTLCEAALASTAALSFFEPMSISHGGIRRTFLDGGFYQNNPVSILWREALAQFHLTDAELPQQIRCILSIGTGKIGPKGLNGTVKHVALRVKELITRTDNTAKEFLRAHQDLARIHRYMRFDPPYMEDVGLADAKKRDIIAELSAFYGNDPDHQTRLWQFQKAAGTEQSTSYLEHEERMSFA